MTVEEFDSYLKSRGVESIDSKELLQTILGVKVIDPKEIDEKISKLRESVLGSATKAASDIKDNIEKVDPKKAISELLGIPLEKVDSTPLQDLRKEVIAKAFETISQMKEDLNEKAESNKKNMADPFGVGDTSDFRKEYRTKLAEAWENIKKNFANSSENIIGKMVSSEGTVSPTALSTGNTDKIIGYYCSSILKKIDELIAIQSKTSPQDTTQKTYGVSVNTVSIDQDSIIRIATTIVNALSLSDKLSELVSETKENKKELGKLSGFLSQKGGGLIDILFDLASLTATGVLGLLFGRGILKLADSIFGTDLVALFDSVTAPLKKFSGYILDAMKGGLMFFSVLSSATALIIKKIPEAISKFTGFIKSIGDGIKAFPAKILGRTANVAGAAGDVGKTAGAVSKAAGVASEAGEAAGAAAKIGIMSKVFGGVAKLFGGGFSAAFGGIFRKIPIIGGLIDLGAAVSNFSSGDNVGGWLRLLGAIASFTSIIPGFGLIGFGISLLTSLLDDALTKEAGGDVTKKQNIDIFGFIGNILSEWSKKVWNFIKNGIKSVFGFGPDEETLGEIKKPEVETKTPTSSSAVANKELETKTTSPSVVEKAKQISTQKTPETTFEEDMRGFEQQEEENKQVFEKINKGLSAISAGSVIKSESVPSVGVNDIIKSTEGSIKMPSAIGIEDSSLRNMMNMLSDSMSQIAIPPSQSLTVATAGGGNGDIFIHGSRDPIHDARSDWWGILNKRKW
jgi:hypothetical protein